MLEELNPGHPAKAYTQALDQLTATSASKKLLQANRAMYALLRDGVPVRYKAPDGTWRSPRLKVLDFEKPENNHFLAVRELWVQGMPYRRRPDLLGFVNGLPLLFIELKVHHKSVKAAYEENLSDYLDAIPHLFHHNAICMLSNGIEARVGTMVSPFDFFHPWKRIAENEAGVVDWETMLRGLCDKRRFLDLVENFIVFDDSPSGGTTKAMAANHQFMGVNRAFAAVQDREVHQGKLGVFWHTQGSGKSYSMVFLSRKVHRQLHGSFTSLMKTTEDQLTREIFGDYVSKYDFKRAVEDGATVPLYYDNRGEKLDIATPNINKRIAEELEKHQLDQDQEEKLRRNLSRDYHVLTAAERLDRIARDMVHHFARRWQTGKAMLVSIDKITCVRMYNQITHHWAAEITRQKSRLASRQADAATDQAMLVGKDEDTQVRVRAAHQARIDAASEKLDWLSSTEICVVVSEEQNEVKTFKKWELDIVPHRTKIKQRDLAEEFKKADHPFRFVIVCAMWLTGFDVPSLATLYLDKPMKGHTLMQAIARANRKAEGKNNGHLVDYNGMLKSLRAALAKYGEGRSDGDGTEGEDPPAEGLEVLLAAFVEVVEQCAAHLKDCGFELEQLARAEGFGKLALLKKDGEDSAINAVCKTDTTRARFEVLAREVFKKRKALVSEPDLTKAYRRRANAIDAIYKRLQDNKDSADITAVMKSLSGVVSEAITHQSITRLPGADSGKTYDISHIDFDKLRREFEKQPHKNTKVQSLKDAVEKKLRDMVRQNPLRMDFYERYRNIIEAYNRETDRVTIEQTFEKLVHFVGGLTEEEQRSVKEGLSEEHLAVFDLLVKTKGELKTKQRDRVKQTATALLEAIKAELAKLDHWKEKRQTRAQVQQLIYDYLYDGNTGLPVEAYNDKEVKSLANVVYLHVYRQYDSNEISAPESVYALAASGSSPTAVSSGAISATPSPGQVGTGLVGTGQVSTGQVSTGQAETGQVVPFPPDPRSTATLHLRRLAQSEVEPFVNSVPLFELEVAAGSFSAEQIVATPGDFEWVALEGRAQPAPGLFVARVVGESMNRRIPPGAWCLWRANPEGTRQGKVVLAQHRDINDPEFGGRYTVKVYQSEKVRTEDGGWQHRVVRLEPDSSDPSFEPIVFEDLEEDELSIIAELVEVLT
jgi:type I restriction enzyme R subunit